MRRMPSIRSKSDPRLCQRRDSRQTKASLPMLGSHAQASIKRWSHPISRSYARPDGRLNAVFFVFQSKSDRAHPRSAAMTAIVTRMAPIVNRRWETRYARTTDALLTITPHPASSPSTTEPIRSSLPIKGRRLCVVSRYRPASRPRNGRNKRGQRRRCLGFRIVDERGSGMANPCD